MPLILASASAIRHTILTKAGVAHEVVPATIDEAPLKQAHRGNDCALARDLAVAKARDVSLRLSGKWVLGADSVVSVHGRRYSKPKDREEAERHLTAFSGNSMALTSAAALLHDGEVCWSHADQAILHVRQLSAEFIHNYLEQEWPAVGACVGVFRMEGLGVQLFETIDGSHFTILGLPLLPLLGALRREDLLAS